MTIEFLEPVERAWQGMVRILFGPFKVEKWLAIGFAAWLAGLAGGNMGGIGWNVGGWDDDDSSSLLEEVVEETVVPASFQQGQVEAFEDAVQDAVDWLPFAVGCLAILIPVAIAFFLLLLWLSSRGMFIYLHDVVHDRGEIVQPWKTYRRRANSLFLWRLGFFAVVMAGVVVGVVAIVLVARQDLGWAMILPIAALLLLWGIAAGVTEVFLRHFVVPLMYRHDVPTTAAWRRFLPTLRGYPLQFLGYVVLLIILWILAGLAIALAGFLTCCVGFVLIAIPYVGTVLLLPVLVFFRLFSLEFLRQFGPEYDLLAAAAPPPDPHPEPAGAAGTA